jgi:hypothetical protein
MIGASPIAIAGYIATTIGMDVKAYFVNRFETTYVPTLKLKTVLDTVIQQVADDNTITVVSNLIEGTMNNEHFITSGDGLRSLVGSKLKITFKQIFDFVNRTFGACVYYNADTNTVYFESRADAFINTVNPDYTLIENVSKFKATPFVQESAVNLNIGCGSFTYDAKSNDEHEITNGKDEFNLTSKFLLPFTKVQGTADYVSPIREDITGIEMVRANLSDKELADADTDNDIFALHCEDSISGSYTFPETNVTVDYRILFRTAIDLTPGASYWEVENIFSPETAYNFIYTPKRCLFRLGNYFRSILKFNDSDYIKFQVSDKNNANNNKLITNEGSTPTIIDEGANELIEDLCANDALLFQPIIFEFQTKEVINLYQFIKDNPFNTLEFPFNGNNYRGFILSAECSPTNRGETNFKLLAAPDTDLTTLEY